MDWGEERWRRGEVIKEDPCFVKEAMMLSKSWAGLVVSKRYKKRIISRCGGEETGEEEGEGECEEGEGVCVGEAGGVASTAEGDEETPFSEAGTADTNADAPLGANPLLWFAPLVRAKKRAAREQEVSLEVNERGHTLA